MDKHIPWTLFALTPMQKLGGRRRIVHAYPATPMQLIVEIRAMERLRPEIDAELCASVHRDGRVKQSFGQVAGRLQQAAVEGKTHAASFTVVHATHHVPTLALLASLHHKEEQHQPTNKHASKQRRRRQDLATGYPCRSAERGIASTTRKHQASQPVSHSHSQAGREAGRQAQGRKTSR